MVIITEKYLKDKIDEYAHALRHDPAKASVLRQEALCNIAKYVEEYNLGKNSVREFDLAYSESANYMMRTYVRIFGDLTQKVTLPEPVKILYKDFGETEAKEVSFGYVINELIRNDAPDKLKRLYSQDTLSKIYYNKCKKAYDVYLRKVSVLETETAKAQTKPTNISPKIDVSTLIKEDFADDKETWFARMHKKTSSFFHDIKEKHQITTEKRRRAKLLARNQKKKQETIKKKSFNIFSSDMGKRVKRIAALSFVTVATGAVLMLGWGKFFKSNQNNSNDNNGIKVAKVEKPYQDAPKDTINAILAHKQDYQKQVNIDTIQKAKALSIKTKKQSKTSSKSVAKSYVSTTKTAAKTTLVSPSAPQKVAIIDTNQNLQSVMDTLLNVNDSIKMYNTDSTIMVQDTIMNDSIPQIKDSVAYSNDSVSADSIASFNLAISGDSVVVPQDTIAFIADSAEHSNPIDSISTFKNTKNANDSLFYNDSISNIIGDQVDADELPDGAFEKGKYKKHIAKCDSVMAAAFGSEENRDNFYEQIYGYIDVNFTPPSMMHLTEFFTHLALMRYMPRDTVEQRIANDIFSGKKLSAAEQQFLEDLPRWDLSLPSRIESRTTGFSLNNEQQSDVETQNVSHKNKQSGYNYYQSRIGGQSGKAYHPAGQIKLKTNNLVLQKLVRAGRIK